MGRNRHHVSLGSPKNFDNKVAVRALTSNDFLCKVNRQLKIPRRAIFANALTVERGIGFFTRSVKRENKKLLGVIHTPIRAWLSHFVIWMKVQFGHTVGRVWLQRS